MKIVQAHKYYWPRDGASKYVLQLSAWLREQGHEVIPLAMLESQSLASPYSHYFVSNVNLENPGQLSLATKIQAAARLFYSRQAVNNVRRLLAAEKIDVAHIHNIYHHLSPAILPILKKSGARVVMTVHDYHLISPNYSLFHHGAIHEEDAQGYYTTCIGNRCVKDNRAYSALKVAEMIWNHKIKKYYERVVDTYIAPSEFMARKLIKYGYDKQKVVVIPNPVEMGVQPKTKNRKNNQDGYVGFAGRLAEEKGVEVVLRAAEYLPAVQFKIAGAGPDEARLRQISKQMQLVNVEFVGFKTGNDLQSFLQQARCLVVPSIWYENAPLSVLEPMAEGKIVLGSAIGGIPEILPPEFLFSPNNPRSLAEKIALWQGVPENSQLEAGKKLQALVASRYRPEVHVERILQVYQP